MSLEKSLSSINKAYFFSEFTYSNTTFKPQDHTEVELADSIILNDNKAVIFQAKERSYIEDTNPDIESKWFRNKILKKATKQVRDTLNYLKNNTITLINHRKHSVTIDYKRITQIHKLVVFKANNKILPNECWNKKFHISRSAGIIHLIPYYNYEGIVKTLITPAELNEYLLYREELIKLWGERLNMLPEQSLVGHYINGLLNKPPVLNDSQYLNKINNDVEEWDITGIMHLFFERIINHDISGSKYYPIVISLSKLKRNELKSFKKSFLNSRSLALSNRSVKAYGVLFSRLRLGFIFINIIEEAKSSQNETLQDFTLAYKYHHKFEKCIGMVFSKHQSKEFDITWSFTESEWEYNEDYEKQINEFFIHEINF